MTDEAKPGEPASKINGNFKTHGASALVAILGTGLIVFGLTDPEHSNAIVAAIVGAVTTLLAGLNAQRAGITKKIDEQQQATKETVASTMSDAWKDQMLAVTQAIVRMSATTESMQRNMVANHAENKGDHERLVAELAAARDADKLANDAAHQEHRDRFEKLEAGHQQLAAGQEKLATQMGEMAGQVGKLAEWVK